MFPCRDMILATFLIFVATAHGIALRDRVSIGKKPASTCSKIISVQSQGVLNYLASVTFKVPFNFDGQWSLEMETSEPFTFFGCWGVTSTSDGQKRIIKVQSKDVVNLQAGDKASFRFRISYPRNQPIPYVSVIRWQGQEICGPVTDFSKMEEEMQGDIWSGTQKPKKYESFAEQLMSFYYNLVPATI